MCANRNEVVSICSERVSSFNLASDGCTQLYKFLQEVVIDNNLWNWDLTQTLKGITVRGSQCTMEALQQRRERRRTLALLLLILMLSLATLATLAGLFLIKRNISFNIEVSSGNFSLPDLIPTVPFPLLIVVRAMNENFFPIVIRHATITGTHPLYNGTLGTGNLTEVTLNQRGNTSFDIIFELVYDPSVDSSGAFILAALRNCSSSADNSSSAIGLSPQASIEGSYMTWIQSGTLSEMRDIKVAC